MRTCGLLLAFGCFAALLPILAFLAALHTPTQIDFDTLDAPRFARGDLSYILPVLQVGNRLGEVPNLRILLHFWMFPLMLLSLALGWRMLHVERRQPLHIAALDTVPIAIYVLTYSLLRLSGNTVLDQAGQYLENAVLALCYPLVFCGLAALLDACGVAFRPARPSPQITSATTPA